MNIIIELKLILVSKIFYSSNLKPTLLGKGLASILTQNQLPILLTSLWTNKVKFRCWQKFVWKRIWSNLHSHEESSSLTNLNLYWITRGHPCPICTPTPSRLTVSLTADNLPCPQIDVCLFIFLSIFIRMKQTSLILASVLRGKCKK